MRKDKIFFVSDEGKKKNYSSFIAGNEYEIRSSTFEEFLTLVNLEGPDCVVLVFGSKPGRPIEDYIAEIHDYDDNLPVIVVSKKGGVEDAVSVMKGGGYDYFVSPPDKERLLISVTNAVRLYKLTKRVYLLEQQTGWQGRFDDMVGHSVGMQEIFQLVSTVAASNATVLIMGESGTGKELVAKAIHRHSKRKDKHFIDINCGAIPKELLENELFGHEKGAYTGADRKYIGSCERAHKGTLFLDEICEMDLALQVKLLRLLQERSISRVGGLQKVVVDIRFIAATNKNITEEVKRGRFREDLFYRLNVVPLTIPPLRERKEDIVLLAKHFLDKYSTKNEKIFVDFASDAMEALLKHNWPGNVRELENVIERVVVLNNDSQVKVKYLPPQLQQVTRERRGRVDVPRYFGDGQRIIPLELVEKYAIEAALSRCGGSVADASKQLKIGQATLYRKIKQYGLGAKD